jgi:hypothetical protein
LQLQTAAVLRCCCLLTWLCACPSAGAILTSLGRHQWGTSAGWGQWLLSYLFFFFWKTVEQGASTTITAALSPDLEEHSGKGFLQPMHRQPTPAAPAAALRGLTRLSDVPLVHCWMRCKDKARCCMCACRSLPGQLPDRQEQRGGAGHGAGAEAVGGDRAAARAG